MRVPHRFALRITAGLLCLALGLGLLGGCRSKDKAPVSSSQPAENGAYESLPSIPTVPEESDAQTSASSLTDSSPAPSYVPAPSQAAPPPAASTPQPPVSAGSQDGSFALDDLYPSARLYTPVAQENKWYYRNLTDKQKGIYRAINQAAMDMQTGKIPLGSCTYPDLALAYAAVKSDHPEYFWLPAGYIYELSGGQMYIAFDHKENDYQMSYAYTKEERNAMVKALRAVLEEAAAVLTPGMSEYQRELALHDWLTGRLTYDEKTAGGSKAHPEAFTIACLLDGGAVCEGYARSFQLLLTYAGVESTLVTGKIQETGHMWNLVKAEGDWYHADVTWNDSGDQGLHTYFNLSDVGIMADHTLDPDYVQMSYDDLMDSRSFNFKLPACGSVYANYFARTGGLIAGETAFGEVLTDRLVEAAMAGNRSAEFAFGDGYPASFSSSQTILQRIADGGYVRAANARLPADKQLPSSISCNGVLGSKGFMISW